MVLPLDACRGCAGQGGERGFAAEASFMRVGRDQDCAGDRADASDLLQAWIETASRRASCRIVTVAASSAGRCRHPATSRTWVSVSGLRTSMPRSSPGSSPPPWSERRRVDRPTGARGQDGVGVCSGMGVQANDVIVLGCHGSRHSCRHSKLTVNTPATVTLLF